MSDIHKWEYEKKTIDRLYARGMVLMMIIVSMAIVINVIPDVNVKFGLLFVQGFLLGVQLMGAWRHSRMVTRYIEHIRD